jgi:hypothetical protein
MVLRLTLAGGLALSMVGCGSRTGLVISTTNAADSAPDIGACGAAVASATSGSLVWTTDFAGPLAGPLAGDSNGSTYFIGVTVSTPPRLTYVVLSLDACGAVRWRSDPVTSDETTALAPSAMVSGDRLVVHAGTTVDAFDLATGAHRWSADVAAFGASAGLGDVLHDDNGVLGPAAARGDGTLLLPYGTSSATAVLQVDGNGGVSVFSRERALSAGFPVSLIVDAAGNVDLLLNTALQGAEAVALNRSGSVAFTGSFGCTQSFIGPLASASDFIVQQDGLCSLRFDGTTGFDDGSQTDGFMVIDGSDNLYFPDGEAVGSDDSSGRARWTTRMPSPTFGAMLGQRRLYTTLLDGDTPTRLGVAALDRATGAIAWTNDLGGAAVEVTLHDNPFGSAVALLASPGVLVLGDATHAFGLATGGDPPDTTAQWPTARGGLDQRAAAIGQ